MRRFKILLCLSAAAAALSFTSTREARACGVPCVNSVVALPRNNEMPANAVAFHLTGDENGIELRDAKGTLIPTAVSVDGSGAKVLKPVSSIAPSLSSQYVLHYPQVSGCIGFPGGALPPTTIGQAEYKFYATDAAPYPASGGTLDVVERGVEQPGMPTASVFTRLKWSPGDALEPFFDMSGTTLTIDGQPFSGQGHTFTISDPSIVTIVAHCSKDRPQWTPDTCGNYSDVPPGAHSVALSIHIPGAAQDPPPVTYAIQVSCDPATATSAPSEIPPGTLAQTYVAAPADPGHGASCSMGHAPSRIPTPGSIAALGAVGVAALVRIAGRRKRRLLSPG